MSAARVIPSEEVIEDTASVSLNSSFSIPVNRTRPGQLAFATLNSALSVTVPETATHLKQSRSEPNSPVQERKTRHGLLKLLTRPSSPRANRKSKQELAPEEQSGERKQRWSRKKKKAPLYNKSTSTSVDEASDLGSIVRESPALQEPQATPVETLPGQTLPVPTILVSADDRGATGDAKPRHNCVGSCCLSEEEAQRKLSQSSNQSRCSQSVTSGVGSMLSPSGDECDGLESPLSPLSGPSSYSGSREELLMGENGIMVDDDLIEKDLASPSSDNSAPVTPSASSTGTTLQSELEGASSPKAKHKDRHRVTPSWDKVKKMVQAWSPFSLQFCKRKYNWVQLAGHKGNFAPGKSNGSIMKKSDQTESEALQRLMKDPLKEFVPEFLGEVEMEGEMYVEMSDLLREYDEPAVMDIKVGVRTYLEDELVKARTKKEIRKDMYEKMVAVDPQEPTEDEHIAGAISKLRYMQWRESLSSTSNLGFRIEGIKDCEGKAEKDFKTTKHREEVVRVLKTFVSGNTALDLDLKTEFLKSLKELRNALSNSEFFKSHELIGSSLLFVYDQAKCSIHMIDFGKTVPLPPGVHVDHSSPWVEGNHEDGYLWGMNNLINIWSEL